jgi:RNA recognition motif-containing protein
MNNKLYVGNLSYSATEETLRDTFVEYGNVVSCKLIIDRDTGRSKGFAFVEMSSEDEANKVIEELNGSQLEGREMKINIARPQEKRESRPRNNRW